MEEYEYELYHHGIKGMKWGVRRFQNKDGSLTPAGRTRQRLQDAGDYVKNKVKGSIEKRKAAKAQEAEDERIRNLMKKPISKLTDAEIAERFARKQKEKQLIDVESQIDRMSKDPESLMKRLANKAINDVAIPAIVDAGKAALTNKIKSTLLDSFGLKNDLKVVKEVVKELTPEDKLKEENLRWTQLANIVKNKENVATYNRTHPDDQYGDDSVRNKNTNNGDSSGSSKSNTTANNSYSPKHSSSGEKTNPVNKPQKPHSTEKTVDAEYKETGPQRSTNTFKTSNSNSKSTHDVFKEMFPNMKNTQSASVSDLYKDGYRMKTTESGKSAFNDLSRSGWTMRSLDDLEKYN